MSAIIYAFHNFLHILFAITFRSIFLVIILAVAFIFSDEYKQAKKAYRDAATAMPTLPCQYEAKVVETEEQDDKALREPIPGDVLTSEQAARLRKWAEENTTGKQIDETAVEEKISPCTATDHFKLVKEEYEIAQKHLEGIEKVLAGLFPKLSEASH